MPVREIPTASKVYRAGPQATEEAGDDGNESRREDLIEHLRAGATEEEGVTEGHFGQLSLNDVDLAPPLELEAAAEATRAQAQEWPDEMVDAELGPDW